MSVQLAQPVLKAFTPATAEPRPSKLLDRVRAACRVRHYSIRTEDAYVDWIRRFILFHHKRHPLEMGAAEINQFLTHLAVEGHVSASTQNQAFSALLFLYQKVLEVEPGLIEGVIRAKRPERLPVILTRDEVRAVLGRLDGVPRLVALLLYGADSRCATPADPGCRFRPHGTAHSPWQRRQGSPDDVARRGQGRAAGATRSRAQLV